MWRPAYYPLWNVEHLPHAPSFLASGHLASQDTLSPLPQRTSKILCCPSVLRPQSLDTTTSAEQRTSVITMSSRKRPISEVEAAETSASKVTRRHRSPEHESDVTRLSYPRTTHPAPPVPFQQPSTLLTFSYTPARVLEFDDSALRYYIDPPRGADLRYGYERWIKRPEEKGRLDGLLKAVLKHKTKVDAAGADGSAWLRDIAVVSWRGVMTK